MTEELWMIIFFLLIIVLYVIKRKVVDKTLYRLEPYDAYCVSDSKLERLYLPINLWRKYYEPIWFFCLFFPFMSIVYILFAFSEINESIISASKYFMISIFLFILPAYLWFKSINGLKFKKIDMDYSLEETFSKIEMIAQKNDWSIVDREPNSFIQAESKFSGLSWGELITIVLINDQILINSIASPFKKTSITTLGKNRSNIKKVISGIKN